MRPNHKEETVAGSATANTNQTPNLTLCQVTKRFRVKMACEKEKCVSVSVQNCANKTGFVEIGRENSSDALSGSSERTR